MWHHHLNPELIKEKWTLEENKQLFELQKASGTKWKEIANYFPRRTDNGIKNQFFSIIRKSLRKACKASGINIGSNVINSIKPKILSEFLNTPIKSQNCPLKKGPSEIIKMRDFVQKFAFNKISEFKLNFDSEERKVIHESMLKMQNMKFFKKRELHK